MLNNIDVHRKFILPSLKMLICCICFCLFVNMTVSKVTKQVIDKIFHIFRIQVVYFRPCENTVSQCRPSYYLFRSAKYNIIADYNFVFNFDIK